MYNQIKNIFKNKIIDNPTSINQNDYYYFYKDSKCKNYFGIKKDITQNKFAFDPNDRVSDLDRDAHKLDAVKDQDRNLLE